MKASPVYNSKNHIIGHIIFCPACDTYHLFNADRWTFNGDLDKPTFKPSMLFNKDLSNKNHPRCHSFVTDGNIIYLGDCSHDMKNTEIELPLISSE